MFFETFFIYVLDSTALLSYLTFEASAKDPTSVVQIGVKGAGCENSNPQDLPNHLWKLISPSVVIARKLGTGLPIRACVWGISGSSVLISFTEVLSTDSVAVISKGPFESDWQLESIWKHQTFSTGMEITIMMWCVLYSKYEMRSSWRIIVWVMSIRMMKYYHKIN